MFTLTYKQDVLTSGILRNKYSFEQLCYSDTNANICYSDQLLFPEK